jgi:hypothetical protein
MNKTLQKAIKIKRVGQSFLRHVEIIFKELNDAGVKAKLYIQEYGTGHGVIWIDKRRAKAADKILYKIGAIGYVNDDDLNFSGGGSPEGEFDGHNEYK